MTRQGFNNVETVNTLKGASEALYNSTKELFSILATCDGFDGETPYISKVTDLQGRRSDGTESNMCGEFILTGKRGGANRIRTYMVKNNGVYIVSVRYGHNIPLRDALKSHGFGGHYIESPTDGKNEDKIRFTVQSFKSFVSLIDMLSSANDETVAVTKDESVTA